MSGQLSKQTRNPTLPKLRFGSPPRKRGGVGGGVLLLWVSYLITNARNYIMSGQLSKQTRNPTPPKLRFSSPPPPGSPLRRDGNRHRRVDSPQAGRGWGWGSFIMGKLPDMILKKGKPIQCQCNPMQCQCNPIQCDWIAMQCQCNPIQCHCIPIQCHCDSMQCQCNPMQCQCNPIQCHCIPIQCQCNPMHLKTLRFYTAPKLKFVLNPRQIPAEHLHLIN